MMKPPICSYCRARFDPFKTQGTTLSFAVSAEAAESNRRLKESRRPGHPRGLHWLCEDHVDRARELTHLEWPEARAQMAMTTMGPRAMWAWLRRVFGVKS